MKVALAHTHGFIAPRVDLADEILIVELNEAGEEVHKEAIPAENVPHPLALVNRLRAEGVDTLICGAISGFLERMLAFNGIRVISWVSASVEEALRLLAKGELSNGYMTPETMMPRQSPFPWGWCHRRGHRHRHGRRRRKP